MDFYTGKSRENFYFIEYRIRAKNEDIKWVREFIRKIPDESRASARFQGSVHDITQYKTRDKGTEFDIRFNSSDI